MSDPLQEALAVLHAMQKSQPGPHVEVLQKAFHALWTLHEKARVDATIVRNALKELETEMYANIPLGAPDPERDPYDEFGRAARDRADRVRRYRTKLEEMLDVEGTRTPDDWCALLGVQTTDTAGWESDSTPYDRPLTRVEFLRRLGTSAHDVYPWSVLRGLL